MYRLGIIKESLNDVEVLKQIEEYYFLQEMNMS